MPVLPFLALNTFTHYLLTLLFAWWVFCMLMIGYAFVTAVLKDSGNDIDKNPLLED